MPYFINVNKSIVALINYKVLRSTFRCNPDFQETDEQSVIRYILRQRISGFPVRILNITRDPYRRLESFFRDKFRKNVFHLQHWQHCQTIFFPFLSVSESNSNEDIISCFLYSTFPQFVSWLPCVYKLDPHLQPQSQIHRLRFSFAGIAIPLPFQKIETIKLETMAPEIMKNNWGVDISIQENSTSNIEEDFNWNNEMLGIVNSIYDKDFILLGYNKITSV